MLYKPGPLVQSLSGTVGSTVFVLGKGGTYIRGTRKGVTPQNFISVARRGFFTIATRAWGELSEANKLTWNGLASRTFRVDRVGVRKLYTGRSLFLRQYIAVNPFFPSLWTDAAPINGTKQGFLIWLSDYETATLTVLVSLYQEPINYGVTFYGCRSFSQAGFSRRQYVAFANETDSVSTSWDVISAFEARFGAPAVGEWYSIEARVCFEGFLVSDLQRYDARRFS